MADKKKEIKVAKTAEQLHDEPRFNKYYNEFMKYQGKVFHAPSGKHYSKIKIMQIELGDIINKEYDSLKKEIAEEDALDVSKVEKSIFKLAKKAYMAEHGLSKEPDDKKILETNVKDYLLNIARRGGMQHLETYEHAVAEIMSAENPIYGKGDERSKLLDALVQTYATNSHKSKHKDMKDLSFKRYNHLKHELSTNYHTQHWLKKHGDVPKKARYDAEFSKTAHASQIIGTVEEFLNEGDINIKETYINAKSYKRADPKN